MVQRWGKSGLQTYQVSTEAGKCLCAHFAPCTHLSELATTHRWSAGGRLFYSNPGLVLFRLNTSVLT